MIYEPMAHLKGCRMVRDMPLSTEAAALSQDVDAAIASFERAIALGHANSAQIRAAIQAMRK